MSAKKRNLRRLEQVSILLVAFFMVTPLAGGTIREIWQAEAEQETTGGQPYQRIQTVIAAWTAFSSFLSIGVLVFQAVIFVNQARISDRQRRLMKGQLRISERQVANEARRLAIEHRARLVTDSAFVNPDAEDINVYLDLTNIGEDDAVLVKAACSFFMLMPPSGVLSNQTTYAAAFADIVLSPGADFDVNAKFKGVSADWKARTDETVSHFHGLIYYRSGTRSRQYAMAFDYICQGKYPIFKPDPDSRRRYDR